MSDWKKILGAIAPKLATAVGGPFAGMATKFIAAKLLGNESASEIELAEAIENASPAQLAQLKGIEAEFKTEMRRLGIEEYGLEIEDRKSARGMKNQIPQIILGCVFVSLYAGLLLGLLTDFLVIPEGQSALLNVLLGILTAGISQVLNYFFGSSSGSKDKTAASNSRM